jgi:hypothetical protein
VSGVDRVNGSRNKEKRRKEKKSRKEAQHEGEPMEVS